MEDTSRDEAFDALLAAVARVPARTWEPPVELDEYRLNRPLGRGGMGSVWLAHDQLLDRLVAIKFIAHAEPDRHTRERFAIEARAAARLAHPNVVTVFRFGELAGRPYLVSQYIRGESLDKLAKPVPWERALELGIALARGLAAAHRAGIVHRDIKPANAILDDDGTVKLVDFGLAKLAATPEPVRPSEPAIPASVTPAQSALTAPGGIAGTPRYLAPEVRDGAPADRRSDVYQLGAILYELVIGRAPLVDLAESGALAPLAEHLGRDAAGFAAAIERCLRSDPDERPASGDDLRELLERLASPPAGGELPEGNPYRGLVPYEAEHRALFFGRGSEMRAVVERLRSEPFVVVTGDSGVGKSSLCRAGLVPNIEDGAIGDGRTWTAVQLVPGRHPVLALASALAGPLQLDESRVAALLCDTPVELPRALRRALGPEHGLLVFVDQLEELALLADRAEASSAGRALGQLIAGVPGVRLLATVRGDFLARVAEVPGLELARAVYVLRSLTPDGAREAIVGPARAKGARFESDALVDTLVSSIADEHAIELPLLAFTLAQLWEARDPATQMITTASLEAIGGVRGALARHADGALDALLPAQRAAARTLLLRLVTPERTRSRRSAEELAAIDPAVLDALVHARLVVVRGDDPPTYELAHERLIDGWPRLASWMSDAIETVAIHTRLATAATDWKRLGSGRDTLWGPRALADAARLEREELTATEAAFIAASRSAVRRRRAARIAVAITIPALAIAFYAGARIVARRDVAAHIAINVREADRVLATAHQTLAASAELRTRALGHFDHGRIEQAEADWHDALARTDEADGQYVQAGRELEAALLLDTGRSDVRRKLAEVTFERLQLAIREHRSAQQTELSARLALYDTGELGSRLQANAHLDLAITPAATVTMIANDAEVNVPPALAPGSYVLVARAPGRATTRIPVAVDPGETLRVAFELPPATSVPDGFVYVPPGRFLYGSRDDEAMRAWFGTAPMHQVETAGYLIARTETTYAQWIAFLESLPAEERKRRRPHLDTSPTMQFEGALDLTKDNGSWTLHITPASIAYTARAGEPLVYRDRAKRKQQDWLRMPVSGISADDAEAYTAWLSRTGQVPHARLCTEREWERAARGADGRAYPAGDKLAPDDANIDVTYDRRDGGFGPDEVGAHPSSVSPFGLLDTVGNVYEIVRSLDGKGIAMRGGAYYVGVKSGHLANRTDITPQLRHLHAGVRICADPP